MNFQNNHLFLLINKFNIKIIINNFKNIIL